MLPVSQDLSSISPSILICPPSISFEFPTKSCILFASIVTVFKPFEFDDDIDDSPVGVRVARYRVLFDRSNDVRASPVNVMS